MDKLHVAYSSALNSIGGDSAMTSLAYRAGLSGVSESGIITSRNQHIQLHTVPEEALDVIDSDASLNAYSNRLTQMCHYGIGQILEISKLRASVPLFLALPKWPPMKQSFPYAKRVFNAVLKKWPDQLSTQESRLFTAGRIGGANAIDYAFRYIASTQAELVMVGGVDSYSALGLLACLEQEKRLLLPGSPDGFIPGEGAGFILLASGQLAHRLKKKWPVVYRPGFGSEPGHLYSDDNCMGDGMTDAVCKAAKLGLAETETVSTLHLSMNGEQYWSKELGISRIRCARYFSEDIDVEHIAQSVGDLGAAYVPTVLAMYQESQADNRSRKKDMILVASDTEERSAMIIGDSSYG